MTDDELKRVQVAIEEECKKLLPIMQALCDKTEKLLMLYCKSVVFGVRGAASEINYVMSRKRENRRSRLGKSRRRWSS